MSAIKFGVITMLALFGQAALASPVAEAAPDASKDFMKGVDTSNWIAVEFQGKTIHYNPAIVKKPTASGTSKARSPDALLQKRATCGRDCCGGSSFNPTSPPYANTDDCAVIRDWVYTLDQAFDVYGFTGDYHGIVFYQTCAFGAGTRNVAATWIGSSDIGDLTRDGINRLAGNGKVGAAGDMGCCNSAGCGVNVVSKVFWKLQCNGC